MMPYEVGKTFIIRVPLLSIETYKELCSEILYENAMQTMC